MVAMSDEPTPPDADATPSASAGQPPTDVSSTDATPADSDQLAAEVAALRAEVGVLEEALDHKAVRRRRIRRARVVTSVALVVVASLLFVTSTIAVWSKRTVLRQDRWIESVGPLTADPAVSKALSVYLTNQLLLAVDAQKVAADALPDQAKFLAVPLTSAVSQYLSQTVDKVIQTPQFQNAWIEANKIAHQQAVALLEGDTKVVKLNGDQVTLDLLPLINAVLQDLNQQVPEIFGHTVQLPQLTSGEVPEQARQTLSDALGVDLPSNFGQVVVYTNGNISTLQTAFELYTRGVVALVVLTLLVAALAVLIAPGRRRACLQLAAGIGLALIATRAIITPTVQGALGNISDTTNRDAAGAAIRIFTVNLRDFVSWAIPIALLVALVLYLIGPGRWAARARELAVVLAGRADQAGEHLGAGADEIPALAWVARHDQLLRFGGVAVGALWLLLWAQSWVSLVVVTVLVGVWELAISIAQGNRRTDTAADLVPAEDLEPAAVGAEGSPPPSPPLGPVPGPPTAAGGPDAPTDPGAAGEAEAPRPPPPPDAAP